ncbi:ATP-grasp domain-containing protein [Methanobacterium aggregans]|uniref:ATP-grasp domain-containing protein n=1 Tax=Methanobacterium aggregans TaxID=1615586 RepID=UPI001AE1B40D|nr:ATP-grasp domain-containing protein [Methanobacterium aggregans]MBP2046211.1 putative ATP-grasp superfamily ATP-dependent carboligase [Methanobacterium aggregans]
MEKVLVVGSNTRPVASSLKKLGYTVYAVDYFYTEDLAECSDYRRSVLSPEPYSSSGNFAHDFQPSLLLDAARDFVDEVDFIICTSGASPENFPKDRVIGNKHISCFEDKYKLYKKLNGEFKLPETYFISDIHDALEIGHQYPEKRFLLKPISGSGGVGILNLEDADETCDITSSVLQEIVEGESVSASVMAGADGAQTILTSQQIIGDEGLGQMEPYGYCGNMAPHSLPLEISRIAEEVVEALKLTGSNGVDMIRSHDETHIIEVNPRFQGTFECAEACLGVNMAEAHMKICMGDNFSIPKPTKFAVKKIIFAKERSLTEKMDFPGVYDKPPVKTVIEMGEPIATVVSSDKILENALFSADESVKNVYSALTLFPSGS